MGGVDLDALLRDWPALASVLCWGGGGLSRHTHAQAELASLVEQVQAECADETATLRERVAELEAALAVAQASAAPASLGEALNSGDGSYRP